MSRQNPWTNTTVGSAAGLAPVTDATKPASSSTPSVGSTTSTCRSTPSGVVTVSDSSHGRRPKGSRAYGSSARSRSRRTRVRSAAMPAATPAAAAPNRAPRTPNRRRCPDRPEVSLMVVHPRHAPTPEPGDDLVVDRSDGPRPVVRGGRAVLAGAEQDRHVADRDRVVPAVDDELVHAHPAGDE